MTDVAEFNRLSDELKRKKNYKKDELTPIHSLLANLQIDEAAAKGICTGLSKLQWLDGVTLLAGKWSQISANYRYIFLQWRWDGKEKEAVIPACLAMAAAIYSVDAESGASFLGSAVASSKFPATARTFLLKGLRKSWIETRDGAKRPAFELLTWDAMDSKWRWDLIEGVVEATLSSPTEMKSKLGKIDLRKALSDWVSKLAQNNSNVGIEGKRLEALNQQLNHAGAPTIVPVQSIGGAEGSAFIQDSAPALESKHQAGSQSHGESRTIPAAVPKQSPRDDATDENTDRFSRVVSAGNAVYRALDALAEENLRYRETTSRRITGLESKLHGADETLKVAEADKSQLRRDVQAERTRASSLKDEVDKSSKDLDAARELIEVLRRELEQVRERLRAEGEKVTAVEQRAEDEHRKQVAILETERQEARRIVGQRIAQAIRPDVQHLRELDKDPPSADQAKFLKTLLVEMLKAASRIGRTNRGLNMAFGIDFGTTNSAVVYNQNTCLDTEGGHPFPSVIALHRTTGEPICGPQAKERKEELQDNGYLVISSVKTQLDDPSPLGNVRGRICTAQDVAIELFKALKGHVLKQTARTGGVELSRAAVSIPIGFPPQRRRVLRAAANRAGVEITDFVSEPTAAFIHCRSQMPDCSRVAVFDWGGGTLDVSILQIRDNEIHELATAGLQEAGDCIDLRIAEWAHGQIMNGRAKTQPFDRIPLAEQWRLRWACERAKIQLSDSPSATIQLLRFLDAKYVAQPIDRSTLNELVEPFIERAIETLQNAMSQAASRSGRADVDRVLLIGGSSKLSALGDRLRQMFKNRVYCPEQPDWAVAQGASYLAGHPGSYKLTQDMCLELCDSSRFDLARAGDTFDDRWCRHHLGIVEESESAQVVFAEPLISDPTAINTSPRLRRLGNISVPMQGFYRERLRLDSRLTKDLTFEARAQSANGDEKNDEHWIPWSYPQLRFAYAIASEERKPN